jgi:leader peptidase (prepilin peptidase)/N-methyltransferase
VLTVPLFAILGALGGWACWLAAIRLTTGAGEGMPPRALPPVATATGGILLAVVASRSGGDTAAAGATALLAAPLLITLLTDLLARLVYPGVLAPGVLAALAFAAIAGGTSGVAASIVSGLAAGAVAGALVLLARRVWPAEETPFGSGDILIVATIGAVFGPERAPAVLFAGVVLGALAAALLLITRRAEREEAIPYGAALCAAALAALALS